MSVKSIFKRNKTNLFRFILLESCSFLFGLVGCLAAYATVGYLITDCFRLLRSESQFALCTNAYATSWFNMSIWWCDRTVTTKGNLWGICIPQDLLIQYLNSLWGFGFGFFFFTFSVFQQVSKWNVKFVNVILAVFVLYVTNGAASFLSFGFQAVYHPSDRGVNEFSHQFSPAGTFKEICEANGSYTEGICYHYGDLIARGAFIEVFVPVALFAMTFGLSVFVSMLFLPFLSSIENAKRYTVTLFRIPLLRNSRLVFYVLNLAPFVIFYAATCGLVYWLPLKLFYASNEEKFFLRVVAFSAIVEFVIAPFRLLGKGLPAKVKGGNVTFMFLPMKFQSLFSRLLCSSVSDEKLVAAASISIGFIEVIMRLTAFQRDDLFRRIKARILGQKIDIFDRNAQVAYKANCVIVDMFFEFGDIVTVTGLVCLMCQAWGPTKDIVPKRIPFRNNFRKNGYIVETYVITNGFIQVVCEFGTDMACTMIEGIMGVPIWSLFQKPYSSGMKVLGLAMLFQFSYCLWFFVYIYHWPGLHPMLGTAAWKSGTNDPYICFGLSTPDSIEVAFINRWVLTTVE